MFGKNSKMGKSAKSGKMSTKNNVEASTETKNCGSRSSASRSNSAKNSK